MIDNAEIWHHQIALGMTLMKQACEHLSKQVPCETCPFYCDCEAIETPFEWQNGMIINVSD